MLICLKAKMSMFYSIDNSFQYPEMQPHLLNYASTLFLSDAELHECFGAALIQPSEAYSLCKCLKGYEEAEGELLASHCLTSDLFMAGICGRSSFPSVVTSVVEFMVKLFWSDHCMPAVRFKCYFSPVSPIPKYCLGLAAVSSTELRMELNIAQSSAYGSTPDLIMKGRRLMEQLKNLRHSPKEMLQ